VQLSRHQVNAQDPAAVYRFVQAALRSGRKATPAIAAAERAALRRAVTATTTRQRPSRPPATTGIEFDDKFRNARIEGYWKINAGNWSEQTIFIDDGVLTNSTIDGAVVPSAQVVTAADSYANVDITLDVWTKSPTGGARRAYIMARASVLSPGQQAMYLWYYDFQTGSYQLERWESAVTGVLASGNAGIINAPLPLRLTVSGGNLTGYINGVDITGVIVDGTPLPAGRVGLGVSSVGFQIDRFRCTVLP